MRKGNIVPIGVDTEVIDDAHKIAGRDAGCLEDLREKSVLYILALA